MEAVVIGAGFGGLAAALRLRAAGYAVTVYEKNDRPGGKAGELRLAGCRFDTGPSLFTLPETVEELFALFGERMSDTIPCRRLENGCRYFFPDGRSFDFCHDPERLLRELREKGFARPESVSERLRRAREVYDLAAPVFLFSDFHRAANFNTPPYRRVGRHLAKLDFLRTMHAANRADFADERLVRIFDRYATYNGSDPYRAPATLNMIAHLENNLGAFLPERGIHALAEGLCDLARRHGVRFRFGERVERILVRQGRAAGVRTAAGERLCDAIVSDADVSTLAGGLAEEYPLRWRARLRRSEPSLSALIFYWVVQGDYPQFDVHNILFSDDYRKEFRALFRQRTLPNDPTVYLYISRKQIPDDAPEGYENWFVMVNAPADAGQDWAALEARAWHAAADRIARVTGERIDGRIAAAETATPLTIERATASYRGALYGPSSNSPLAAFLRHPNSLRALPGLYFVGGSVHPGGGIPLCLAGARIACDQIAACHG